MKLSVIILSYNTKELLKKCLESITQKSWKTPMEIVVVDNASTDGSNELVKKSFPKVILIENKKNLGFSAGNNVALKKLKADYYLLLNSDTEVEKGSLDRLVNFIEESNFSIATCKLVNKDGSFQPNAGDLPVGVSLFSWLSGLDDLPILRNLLPSFHSQDPRYFKKDRKVGWVSGTAMLIKAEVIKKIGYLDDNIFMYAEDVEYCLRAYQAGFKIGWTPKATIMHLGGGSSDNPSYRQWVGEFRGLLYIYGKYFGRGSQSILRGFLYIFSFLRMIVFFIIGKGEAAKTYAKVIADI